MALGPWKWTGVNAEGQRCAGIIPKVGTRVDPDLPIWVKEMFDQGFKSLEVVDKDGMTNGWIGQRKMTTHPKSNTYRSWIADDRLGWRKSGS